MDILEVVILEETETKGFYKQACEESGTSLGKALFTRLAKEEDFHAAALQQYLDWLTLRTE